MSKNDNAPQTDSGDTVTQGASAPDVRDASVAPAEPSEAVEGYKLTKLKDEEIPPAPGFVTLRVVAEGTFKDSNGNILRTGDELTMNSTDASVLLDTKVGGKSAFEAV